MNNPIRMSEFLFRNFQLLVSCGLLHQLSVTEISDPFCHTVYEYIVTTRTGQDQRNSCAVKTREQTNCQDQRTICTICTVRTSEQRHFQEKSTSLTSSIFNKLNRANTHVSKTFLRVKEPCLHISLCFFPCLGTG